MVKSRRNLLLVLVLVLILSTSVVLAACNSKDGGSNTDNSSAAFTVKFLQENDMGQWVEYKKVTSVNGSISAPVNPTRTDYSFVGWYTSKNFATKVDDVTTIKASTTLYAKFAKVNFQVKFMSGDVLVSTVKSAGKTVELPSNPEAPEGKVFAGWYKDEALTDAFENGTVTSDMTVYAKFNDVNTTYPDCSVKLMVDGNQFGDILTSHFGAITLPENLAKENWTFIGWYTDEAFENAFVNGSIQTDTTLYAKFQQVNFTIKFMNGETVVDTVLSNKNKVVAPTIPDKKGYEFKGWFYDTNFRKSFDVNNVTKDATVYANIVKLPGKNVTFMIPNVDIASENEWVEYKVVESDSVTDKIELPANPDVKYMTFKGWYQEKECTNKFDGTETITKEMTIYANCLPIEVTVHFDGEDKGTKNLSEIQNNFGQTVGEGQTVDGWYTDKLYGIKWDEVTIPQDLYGRTAIAVVFNNGYEDIYTGAVQNGENFVNPHDTTIKVEGKEQTLESFMIKDYMSDRDISYLDETGKPFDFNQTITKATKVIVRWNSNIGESNYKLNPKTGNYYIEPSSLPNAPIISLLSDVTIMLPESNEKDAPKVPTKIKVEAFTAYSDVVGDAVKKIVIGEGFVSIKGITGGSTCVVENIVLPDSLKIIDGCFNNMAKLTNVTIPEGVEVIIGSFFKTSMQDYKTYYLGTPYNFDITIPASVKNMAHVPNNFVFAAGSKFSKEAGYIYQDTTKGKVLISDPAAYSNFDEQGRAIADTIIVPEGVVGIQVGTYNVMFNYLKLPSTFRFVNYNAKASDYPEYRGMEGSAWSFSSIMLFDENALDAPSSKMSPQAYTITTNLGGYNLMGQIISYAGKVIFATETVPTELNAYAFAGDVMGWAVVTGGYQKMDDEALKDNVILKDAVNKSYVTIMYNNSRVNVEYLDAKLDSETIQNDILSKLPEDARKEILDNHLLIKFYVDNKEVSLGDVTSDMYITAKF